MHCTKNFPPHWIVNHPSTQPTPQTTTLRNTHTAAALTSSKAEVEYPPSLSTIQSDRLRPPTLSNYPTLKPHETYCLLLTAPRSRRPQFTPSYLSCVSTSSSTLRSCVGHCQPGAFRTSRCLPAHIPGRPSRSHGLTYEGREKLV